MTFCLVDPGDNAELSMFVTCLAAQIVNKTGGFVFKDVLRLLLGCKRSLALCILLRAEALAVVGKEERWREGGRERKRESFFNAHSTIQVLSRQNNSSFHR